MMDWVREINWLLTIAITSGALLGTEFRRRRDMAEGKIHSFLPLWTSRLLGLALCVSLALVFESAKVAVYFPNVLHVWMLILATISAFVFSTTLFELEMRQAKRALQKLVSDGIGKPDQD